MSRSIVQSARLVAVHNEFIAQELRDANPTVGIERIHLGVPALTPSAGARERLRRQHNIPAESVVFIAFGLVTAEKRVDAILRAFSALRSHSAAGVDAHLLLVGANEFPALDTRIAEGGVRDRVHVTGYVPDALIADYLAAADVSLSLRWPTAGETSASWAACLAASKPTIITSLPHTADVPSLDAWTWRPTRRSREPVAVSVDLLEEDTALLTAMSRLVDDEELRGRIGHAGHEYWKREHDLATMTDDYRRVIAAAAATADAPRSADLPLHLTTDYSARAMSIASDVGVDLRSLGV
jgi:glycosyltransferase involved in cell wall biosynthesis